MMLKKEKFLEVIRNTPLISIDLIIRNSKNEILLGYRNNRPAQNYYFVPGGRIMKNETINNAFERILSIETGILKFSDKKLIGVYDHIYEDNFAGIEGINTHYVVIGFEVIVSDNQDVIKLDMQHEHYEWMNIEKLLQSEKVHQNTKNYFI